MTYTPTYFPPHSISSPQSLTFEAFIAQYGDNPRYELIDGVLRDMEPTGPHEDVAGNLSARIYGEILRSGLNWLIPKSCLIKPPALEATALRPDVVVLDRDRLSQEPLWQREPIICNGNTIQLVVEVTSSNWQDDYARKVEEYAYLGIVEYWIVDFRALGGIEFIGKPKQPTFNVYRLRNDRYERQMFRLGEAIESLLLPNLVLKLDDLMC
jgi:Uma2 family endonuclease